MTTGGGADALIEIRGLRKDFQGLRPLRVNEFVLRAGDRVALSGVDAPAAEAFTHVVTGAALPDEGTVHVFGTNTRDIANDVEWLASLDRFGIVTPRAILLESMSLASNLALPFTVAIDPIAPDIRERLENVADDVELPRDRLNERVGDLNALERQRVHLARALAADPRVLLLEHPTASLSPAESAALGDTLRRVSDRRKLAWISLGEDREFAKRAGGTRFTLKPGSGDIARAGFLEGLWSR